MQTYKKLILTELAVFRIILEGWRARRGGGGCTGSPKKTQKLLKSPIVKAVFQLRVFHAYVHARKTLNHFNITFEMNNCLQRENSAFPTN